MGGDHLPADDRDGQQRQRQQDRRETSARVSDAAALLRSAHASARSARRSACIRPGGAHQIEARLAGRHGGVLDPAGAKRRMRSIVGRA